MPSYADRNRSLLYALSDFWTQIFADSDTVESVYRGAEILVGQIYLDLLGDMLNMSVRDTALFRKELFRLIRVREDTVLRAPDGRYRVPLGTDIAEVTTLNNKVFEITAALERGADFEQLGTTGLFKADPTAAQPVYVHGTSTSLLRFTGVLPGEPLRVWLQDDGAAPLEVELVFDDLGAMLIVHYDGPSNGGTCTATIFASSMSSSAIARERVIVECLVTQGAVTAPPDDQITLSFAHGLPAAGFGARTFPVTFGTKFTAPGTAAFGAELGVEKGDILRLEPSSRSGAVVEVPIALVRDDALYSHFAGVPEGSDTALRSRRDFTILRTPVDAQVELEPWVCTTSFGADVQVERSTSTLYAPLLIDADAWLLLTHGGALAGTLNAGPVTLESWDTGTKKFTFYGAEVQDETDVPLLMLEGMTSVAEIGGGPYTLAPVTGLDDTYDVIDYAGDPLDVGGVLYLTDDLGVPGVKSRVIECNSGVLRVVDTQFEVYTPSGALIAAAVIRASANTFNGVTALDLDRPDYTLDAPELRTEVLNGSLVVHGRRLFDGRALEAGVDWVYVPSMHGVRWYAPPDLRSGVSFDYEVRQVIYASTDLRETLAFPASLGYVSGTDKRVKLYDATPADITRAWRIGDRIELDASLVNTGTYYVAEILPGGAVVLDGGHTPVLPEALDGSIGVDTWRTGAVDIDAPEERIVEVAMWAPDIQVDRMSLATTYGYLLDRIEPSSERYRSTLRGLMQLYMLGPTVARLEAAVHVLAGLPVVRDENELVLGYERATAAQGASLELDGPTRRARLSSGSFPATVEGYLIITDGFNAGRIFTVESKVSSTELLLTDEPFTESGASWEIVGESTHAVITDRNRYTLPITVPFKDELTDSSSFGALRLRAFSTFTDAVQVRDEVAEPGWWQDARIPSELWPGQAANRLQSSPAYVEHVLGAVDDPCIGDPGLRIGTDDGGVEVPRATLHSEVGDASATLSMDPHAPFSYENATFTSVERTTSVDDVGYVIATTLPNGDEIEMQILGIVDANTWRVGLPMTLPGGSALCPDWQLIIDTAILRHNTAFIVFDRYLKQHVFQVDIDATLLGGIDATLLSEIQARLREVKPAHAYMLLSPSSTFTDVLDIEDSLWRQRQIDTAGPGGDALVMSPNSLRIDGTWRIGDFFRYTDWERTDDLTGPVPPIAQSPLGYFTDIHNIEWTSGVEKDSAPAALEFDVGFCGLAGSWHSGDASFGAQDASGGAWITFDDDFPVEVTPGNVTLGFVSVTSGTQTGTYRIGRVVPEERKVRVYAPGAFLEPGITADIFRGFAFSATVQRLPDGSTTITAPADMFPTDTWYPDAQTYTLEPMTAVGLDGTGVESGLVDPAAPWQLGRSVSDGVWELGFVDSRARSAVPTTATVSLDAGDLLLTLPEDAPLEQLFTDDMGYANRYIVDPTTAGAVKVGVEFSDASDSPGVSAVIVEVRSAYVAVIEALYSDPAVGNGEFFVWRQHAATLPSAPVTLPVRCVMGHERYVLGIPTRDDAGTLVWEDRTETVEDLLEFFIDTTSVGFHAYGRMSPQDIDATPAEPENGDTPFSIGGLSPSLRAARRRGMRDFDITELPLEITRSAVTPDPELLYMNGEPVQMNGEDVYVTL